MEDRSGDVTRLTQVTGAQLFVYPLQTSEARPIVVVCPGGGYEILATDLEGAEIAAWLNSLGYVAAVLHYRVPQNRVGALHDGQRAISLLRTRAGEFGAALDCLGVLGFSARGHLAVRLAVSGTDRAYIPRDALDDVSCRPDFALAIYPAYLVDKGTNLPGAGGFAAGGNAAAVLGLKAGMMIIFACPLMRRLRRKQGAHVQNRVYESGGHGYGARLDAGVPAARWQADAEEWASRAMFAIGCRSLLSTKELTMKTKTYDITDFGAGNDGSDSTWAVHLALQNMQDRKSAKLVFPKGRYHFWPHLAHEQYLFPSNNDPGLKRVVFPLAGLSDIEIDGAGSIFVFHGRVVPFVVENSRNVRLTNFSIDWDRTFHNEGEVLDAAKEPGGRLTRVDLRIPGQFPYRVEYGRLALPV